MDEKLISWPGWDVVREIGRGSFGAVYEIQRVVRGRTEHAALKVITIPTNKSEISELRAEGYDDDSITQYFADSLERIEDEYAMMADMKGHANIVYCDDLHTIQHSDGFGWDIYIKMELLTPMKDALKNAVTDEQVIRFGMDICNALVLCKQLNIVHRDIKPENIFMSRDGGFKLGDFGIAKTMVGTSGGTKTGTYDYMAPEVYNNRPYHTEADIYSLGIVLYWLLNERTIPFVTKKRPTPSEKMEARRRRFAGEAIPKPKHGSEALKAIVLKACAYEPKERYADPAEMLEELEAVHYGHKVPKKEPKLRLEEPNHTQWEVVEPIEEETVRTEIPARDDKDSEVGIVGPEVVLEVKDEPKDEGSEGAKGSGPGGTLKSDVRENEEVLSSESVGCDSGSVEFYGKSKYRDKKQRKNGLVVFLLCVVIGLGALVMGYYTIHFYTDPTCIETAVCKLCGKMGGELSDHEWMEATYESPKTCSVCHVTEGNVKGYIGSMDLEYIEERFYDGKSYTHGYELEKEVKNCFKFTLTYEVSEVEGDIYGDYEMFVRTDGEWVSIGMFRVEEEKVSVPFLLEPAISFDAIAVFCRVGGSYSFMSDLWISDIQVRLG